MAETSIEWTDKVWNPTTGCTRISAGCKNCYAFELHDKRHEAFKRGAKLPQQYAKPFTELQMFEDRLEAPLRWKKPCRVFVNSMSDLFHEDVPFESIDRVFAVMRLCPQHTFQVLTKRAHRMAQYFGENDGLTTPLRIEHQAQLMEGKSDDGTWAQGLIPWPIPNVWLGVSVENQEQADKRIPWLLKVPAAVRFLSVEPMLGPIELSEWMCTVRVEHNGDGDTQEVACKPDIHWVIVGGESGTDARPCSLDWVRPLKQQCHAVGVPFFFKQAGSFPSTGILVASALHFKDKKGSDPSEWPEDLRVREFPKEVSDEKEETETI